MSVSLLNPPRAVDYGKLLLSWSPAAERLMCEWWWERASGSTESGWEGRVRLFPRDFIGESVKLTPRLCEMLPGDRAEAAFHLFT